MKKLSNLIACATVILAAIWFGSWLQLQSQGYNAHAHLSDVNDAITLGTHFTNLSELSSEQLVAAKATRAVIARILMSSEPGPNAKARLESLEAQLTDITARDA